MLGRTISHYEIIEKLGGGGMGVVYKARDLKLHRSVALKFLPHALIAEEEIKARFTLEARAASALDHANICTIYDIDEADDGQMFIAMAYYAGETLKKKIQRGPLPLRDALDFAIQVNQGLAEAHRKGIVHRDIKPANVMVTEDAVAKILDFGLAQLADTSRLTKTGSMLGTPAYMSPEQAQSLPTDRRTDIWSLGVVLFEMVTGRLPFQGERDQAVVYSIISKPHEPMTSIRVGVPVELDRIASKALAKRPSERYQHVDDMLVDMQTLRGHIDAARAPGPRSAGLRSSPRRSFWTSVLAVLLAAGLLAWMAHRTPDAGEPLRAAALTTFPGAELYPSFSPDGKYLAFTWTGPKQDNQDIYVQQIGAGSPLRLTTDQRTDYNPVWSPDGRWIAFIRGESTSLWPLAAKGELRLVPPLGGPEVKLADIRVFEAYAVRPRYLNWCPDSKCLVVTDSPGEGKPDALFLVSLESGEKTQLTDPQPPTSGDTDPAVSPDGRSLVFRRGVAGRAGELYWLPLGSDLTVGHQPHRLELPANNPAYPAWYPAWMPDSKEILFSSRGSLWRLAIAGGGAPARLAFVGQDGIMPVVSHPQADLPSRLVYVQSFTDMNIWRVETSARGIASSSPPTVSIASTRLDSNPQFSPDGRRVALVSNRSGEMEIWLADADGSNAVQITSMGAPTTGTPRWSPDGHEITFDSNLNGQFEVYVVPSVGGKPRRVTAHPANDHVPSFSHDGRWIYFSSNRTGEYQIWKVPASGGDAVQVTRNIGYVAFESPDGAYVYYIQAPARPSALWRVPTSEGQAVKVLDGVVFRAFVVGKRGIYYVDRPARETRLRFFDFSTESSTTVVDNLGEISIGLTASPDGRTILYTRPDSSIDDLILVEGFR